MSDISPLPIDIHPWKASDNTYAGMTLHQWIYRFPNGYGASVVRGQLTYGGDRGLYELGVIVFDGDQYQLTYDTPVTDDVLGWLTIPDVAARLLQIAALPDEAGEPA